MSESLPQNYEVVRAGPDFEVLLRTGIDICFSSPQAYQANLAAIQARPSSDPEQRALFSEFGLWGVQTAHAYINRTFLEVDDKGDRADPFTLAASFGGRRDQSIVDKIEAFGQTLLDEAFDCLGPDAADQARRMSVSTSTKTDFEIIDWLAERVETMQRQSSDSVDEQNMIGYNPVRLSPKIIGQHPDVKINTTCLGMSILLASFFEKAGLRHMHAGVAVTDSHQARQDLMDTIALSVADYQQAGIPIPDMALERLKKSMRDLRATQDRRRGYHAMSMVRTITGSWLQADVNIGRSIYMAPHDSDYVDGIYERISDMAAVQQGFELLTPLEMDRPARVNELLLSDAIAHGRIPSVETLDAALTEGTMPRTAQQIAERWLKPVFFGPSQHSFIGEIQDNYETETSCNEEEFIRTLSDVVKQYVFEADDDNVVAKALDRCVTDGAYRQRRVEDMRAAALYATCRLTSIVANKILTSKIKVMHAGIEFGMPAYRIGAAALSDFSVYMQPLPQSFWATYWPSNVVITEHAEYDTSEKAAQWLNYGLYGLRNRLNYVEGNGIILKLLERYTVTSDNQQKDEEHGQAQPEQAR